MSEPVQLLPEVAARRPGFEPLSAERLKEAAARGFRLGNAQVRLRLSR